VLDLILGKSWGGTVTETQWLKSAKPDKMLEDWAWPVSERKFRLFCCACCRRIWSLLTAPESRKAVEVSEALADGRAREGRRESANGAAASIARREREYAPVAADEASKRLLRQYRLTPDVADWASRTAYYAAEAAYSGAYEAAGTDDRAAFNIGNKARDAESRAQAGLLRDIIGNPFQPVAVDARWLTFEVISLAEGIYDERAFDRMPILADALQDAGCDRDDILNHCRGPGPHVRGCWVVDLVLGKG
jgi:hypothetical protein